LTPTQLIATSKIKLQQSIPSPNGFRAEKYFGIKSLYRDNKLNELKHHKMKFFFAHPHV
jgi:hypothetical protein